MELYFRYLGRVAATPMFRLVEACIAFEGSVLVRAVEDGHAVPRGTSNRPYFACVSEVAEAAAPVRQLFLKAQRGRAMLLPGLSPGKATAKNSRRRDFSQRLPVRSVPVTTAISEEHRVLPTLILTVPPGHARRLCPFRNHTGRTLAGFARCAIEGLSRPSWLSSVRHRRWHALSGPVGLGSIFRQASLLSVVPYGPQAFRVVVSSCDGAIRGRLR